MFSHLLIAALAAATAFAAPAPPASSAPASADEYHISLQASGYPALTLNILHTGAGEAQAAFERPSVYAGTPAFLNDTYLNFDVGTGIPYGTTFQEVGDNYGTKVPVYANEGATGRSGFAITDGVLSARLDSAEDAFFACNTTIDGQTILGLFWGVFQSNGSAPQDCTPATLHAVKIQQ